MPKAFDVTRPHTRVWLSVEESPVFKQARATADEQGVDQPPILTALRRYVALSGLLPVLAVATYSETHKRDLAEHPTLTRSESIGTA